MTDKEQVIIDGVDVSECLFYQINFEEDHDVKIKHFCSNWHNSCESINNSNCYFKQLARKTQECEQYKKRAVCFKDVNKQLGYKYLTIKQECEELKEENQKLEMQLCNDCGERDDYNIPCKMIRDLDYGLQKEIEENDRYRKALEDIKEYTRKQFCDNCEDIGSTEYTCHCEYCEYQEYFEIIEKVKDGNNEQL